MTQAFEYRANQLFAEDVAVKDIHAQYGSPCYIYSRAAFENHFMAYENALTDVPHLVCYAVKANSNIAVLNILSKLGAGFDIVSVGELERVVAAGGDASKVVFSGVAKTEAEIKRALELGIYCFNAESDAELDRINKVAGEQGKTADISLRVNPDVDAKTHPYISTGLKENKFGISVDHAIACYQRAHAMEHLNVVGMDCHIGSQLTEIQPFIDAMDRLLMLIDALAEQGIIIKHLDLGGGLGVVYDDEQPPAVADFIDAIKQRVEGRNLKLIFEPGRSIAANAGIMTTQVEFLKPTEHKNFAIIDGAMNDLLRPSLYGAWQAIVPVSIRPDAEQDKKLWDLVGPVCETGDFLGKDRELDLQPGDLLAVKSAGAYGFTMSSNYNSRNRAAEIMVDGDKVHLIRQRETIEHQLTGEQLINE
ncbi:diaminopimelate decarboxylase [Litoribrevibacter albus]|uniref:Diaminopimelate decarboxylase n=1 Tax=Litoribrevibacter albus TaxID=1473156 RepID=A0AA37SCR1_9GAMM|nr:diaminopimelate decarboxylase [Litoribrevibacter albus]GLQ33054.1 diaminopimelate decarboxylase [Litoribrevibacter albus]